MVEYNDNDEDIGNDDDDDDDDDGKDGDDDDDRDGDDGGDDDDHDAGAGADDNDLMSERKRLIKESKGSRSCSNKLEGFSPAYFAENVPPKNDRTRETHLSS